MAGKPGFYLTGLAAHGVQRGHGRNCFIVNVDGIDGYPDYLKDAAGCHGCRCVAKLQCKLEYNCSNRR